jgi:multiple sugar transport system ATP-binding protein
VEEQGHLLLEFEKIRMELPEHKKDWANSLAKRKVLLGIRPEHITIGERAHAGTISGTVDTVEPLGREYLLHVGTSWGELLVLSSEKKAGRNEKLAFSFDPERIHLFDPDQKDA